MDASGSEALTRTGGNLRLGKLVRACVGGSGTHTTGIPSMGPKFWLLLTVQEALCPRGEQGPREARPRLGEGRGERRWRCPTTPGPGQRGKMQIQ